ncbi:type II toxin-antitoxin system RelE/ParE family toxin [Crocosphaera sp.]|uniref:type II toxin-antitoxin system RelE family toxin n=1 Tax=Crocosphaera sp. TaxID=2729996 RepID=UPI00260CE2E3|nr:type II toxin-antitoxin system RelE/ParE family toxin [Crocosphaera sp.]MDJ0581815.1 type II toxin-antitoxin system RelE/ParE family toxin [Crocosphaera sp.]
MIWKVTFKDEAVKQLRKLNPNIQDRITNYLRTRIATEEDPRRFGKALTGDLKGLWRYRVDDYRIVCLIDNDILTVLIVKIGHRRNIYVK